MMESSGWSQILITLAQRPNAMGKYRTFGLFAATLFFTSTAHTYPAIADGHNGAADRDYFEVRINKTSTKSSESPKSGPHLNSGEKIRKSQISKSLKSEDKIAAPISRSLFSLPRPEHNPLCDTPTFNPTTLTNTNAFTTTHNYETTCGHTPTKPKPHTPKAKPTPQATKTPE
ncbi:hypothetical protein ACUIAC_05545, partial [Dermabacteraceae bacterium P13138]